MSLCLKKILDKKKVFELTIFSEPNFFFIKFSFQIKKNPTKTFLNQEFLWTKIFFEHRIFSDLKSLGPTIYFLPETFLNQKIFRVLRKNLFRSKVFLRPRIFLEPTFFLWANNFFWTKKLFQS